LARTPGPHYVGEVQGSAPLARPTRGCF